MRFSLSMIFVAALDVSFQPSNCKCTEIWIAYTFTASAFFLVFHFKCCCPGFSHLKTFEALKSSQNMLCSTRTGNELEKVNDFDLSLSRK